MDSRQCQVCGEVFRNTNDIMSHISEHSKKDIYDCLVALKSSLEFFMKQYFALKKFIESNSSNEKCNQDNSTSSDDNEQTQLNSVEMGDNSILKQDLLESGHDSSEISLNWNPRANVSYRKTENTSHFQINALEREQSLDQSRLENDESLNSSRNSQREHNNDYENLFIPFLSNKNQSQKCDVKQNKMMNHNKNITSQEKMDMFRNVKLPYDSVSKNRNQPSQDNIDGNDLIDLTDIEIKEEYTDEYFSLNSEVVGDNPSFKSVTEKMNENSRELTHISENCVGKNIPVSIIDLSKRNLQPQTYEQRNELIDKTKQFVVREINENLKNRMLNSTGTTCLECGRVFSTKFVLRRHMMSHTGERTHACPICGKGFIGKQNMMVHLRVHTGERPYKCPYCNQQFSQYGTLYRHKKRHLATNDLKLKNFPA